ncbi:DNA-binding response regulator [Paenibacillus sp. J22TS3]|nr:DNA-binding response regulator [Paenibacillus sp. J22TS3]
MGREEVCDLMNQASILLVDDEPAITQMLKKVLQKEGFVHIHTAETGEEALEACKASPYDLIVLDIMMPGISGIEICPFIRQYTDAPIFFLTARDSDFDKLTGFAVGGDDYITKPFNPLEVVARIKSQLRRHLRQRDVSTGSPVRSSYDFGRFQLYPESGELWVEGNLVPCPSLVYQLLLFLCQNPNRIFTKTELYERVWGMDGISEDNTVMVHIHRIRERIEVNPSRPEYVINVRGMGYKLVTPMGKHER